MKYPSHYFSKIGKITTYILVFLCITTAAWASGGGRRSMGVYDVLLLPRVWIGAVFCLAGIGLLMKSWVHRNLRLVILGAVFFTFGILPALPLGRFAWGMGMHPSPVCAITMPFLFLSAGRGVPVIFLTVLAVIAVFSIVGNKVFCGWACPIGTVQELFIRFPYQQNSRL